MKITDDVYKIHDVLYKKDEEFIPITQLNINSDIEVNGENSGNLKSLIEVFFQEHIVPQIDKYKKDNFLEIFKTKEDAEKMMVVESEYSWPDIKALDQNGNTIIFSKIKYVILGMRKTINVEQEHKVFNNKMVSISKHLESDGSTIDFRIVQDPDTRKMHVQWFKEKGAKNA